MGRPVKTTDTDVLDVTYVLAWQRGCDDLTIRDLEVALDLRAPSIYRRFHSRDELLAAAIDRYSDSPNHDLARALLQGFLGVLMLMRCGHDDLEPSLNVLLDSLLGADLQSA